MTDAVARSFEEDLEKGAAAEVKVLIAIDCGAQETLSRPTISTESNGEKNGLDVTINEPSTAKEPMLPNEAHTRLVGTDQTPNDVSDDISRGRRWAFIKNMGPRRYHHWKSPLLMGIFYVCGLAMSIAHCAFYAGLENSIVGDPRQQATNLRQASKPFMISLSAAVWQAYTQWLWRSVGRTPMSIPTLNAVFGADTSVLVFLKLDMFKKFKLGYLIGLFAWSLILPPFFTPATLFVYPSTNQEASMQAVPSLTIANSSEGNKYAYSPSYKGDTFENKNDTSRVFSGPRTILTLLSTATASRGEILPIKAPYNHSSYSVQFYGPAVQCLEAESSVAAQIDDLLRQKMETPIGTAKEVKNALYSFVPSFSPDGVVALSDVRYQAQMNGSNEIWQVFMRYIGSSDEEPCQYQPYHQVCKLWNATYDLDLSWENGIQNVTGSRQLLHEVPYPNDAVGEVSDMPQHAASAFFWVLADQVVGSFGWYNDTSSPGNDTFGMITSPIQHNSLLGTSDLDVFFDFNENATACTLPYDQLTPQRRQDKDMAQNRTLDLLIEELSFNITASLLHNDLLAQNTIANVTYWRDVNRYGYSPTGLFIPYALACLFTTAILILGAFSVTRYGVYPDREFQDILFASCNASKIKMEYDQDSQGGRRTSLGVLLQDGLHPMFHSVSKK